MTYDRDWEKALINSGLDIPLNKRQFNIACPFHSDRTPSLSISLDKGVWICHSFPDECGRGKLNLLLSKFLGISSLEAERLAIDDELQMVDLLPGIEEEHEELFTMPEINFPFNEDMVPSWILKRGFNTRTLTKWGCAFDKFNGSLAVPILYDNGRNVGWLKRQPEGWNPKYLYSSGFQKSKMLFGLYHFNNFDGYIMDDSICLTEGPLDTIWLDQHFVPAVALLGLFMSKHQEKLLSSLPVKEVILCLDNDVPGRTATKNIFQRLSKYFLVSEIQLSEGIKDVQDVRDPQLLIDTIKNRTIF